MFLNTIYVIAREMFEVSYVAFLVLVLTSSLPKMFISLRCGFLFGVAGGVLYALSIEPIARWAGGVGVDIFAVLLFGVMFLAILFISFAFGRGYVAAPLRGICACILLACSGIKEVSEIVLYVMPGWRHSSAWTVLSGTFVGIGVGLSACLLLYFLIMRMRSYLADRIAYILLTFLGGGLLMQCVSLLSQAGWLHPEPALWNTSTLLPEDSILGQLAFALLSYEATPTLSQCVAYILGVLMCWLSCLGGARAKKGDNFALSAQARMVDSQA